MRRRRTAPVDPEVVARVVALLDARGWTPPGGPGSEERLLADQPPRVVDPSSAALAPAALAPAALLPSARPSDAVPPPVPPPAAPLVPEPTVPQPLGPDAGSVLERWRGGRLDPGRRGVAALALLAVLAAALAGVVVLRSRPQEVAAPALVQRGRPVVGSAAGPTATPGAGAGAGAVAGAVAAPTPGATAAAPGAPGPAAASPSGPDVVVAVGGRVRRPGLVHLPAGSRVDDAVRAAGGALRPADLALVNTARRLVDGEQVLVGVPAHAGAAAEPGASGAAPPAGSGTGAAGGPVDLNTATVGQLDDLPGIGPVLAQRIVDWRTEHGRFGSVDQLREVGGIGEAKYSSVKSRVTV